MEFARQFLAKKILLELYLPMSMYNSNENLWILHFQPSARQLATHMIHTFHTGTLHWWLKDKRNDLFIENRIWYPSVRLHWVYILSFGFLTSNTLHILTWHTPQLDCPLKTMNAMDVKYRILQQLTLTKITLFGMSRHVVWQRGIYVRETLPATIMVEDEGMKLVSNDSFLPDYTELHSARSSSSCTFLSNSNPSGSHKTMCRHNGCVVSLHHLEWYFDNAACKNKNVFTSLWQLFLKWWASKPHKFTLGTVEAYSSWVSKYTKLTMQCKN